MDWDKEISEAWDTAASRYTVVHNPRGSNIDRVAHLAASDYLVANPGTEIGYEFLAGALYMKYVEFFNKTGFYGSADREKPQ